MTESPETSESGLADKNWLVVMVLPHPPSSWSATDWYWHAIAGVPFLLRNVLTLQRGGVERLILLAEKNGPTIEDLCQKISADSRVKLKLECLSDSQILLEAMNTATGVLFLDGASLHNKTIIEKTRCKASFGQNKSFQILSLDSSEVNALLQGLTQSGLAPWLEKKLQPSGSPSGDWQKSDRPAGFLTATGKGRITEEKDFQVHDAELIQTCGLSNDSFMDRHVTRHISRQLTRMLIHTPLTPNQITVISLVVGLASAGCFLPGSYVAGIIGASLLLLSAWIDCTDGEVARLKFLESPFGKQLDILCDNIVHFAVFFCIGLGLYAATGKIIFVYLGIAAVVGSFISFLVLSPEIIQQKTQAAAANNKQTKESNLSDKLANRDFTYFLFFTALIGRLDLFLGLTAIGANVFAGFLLFKKFKSKAVATQNT